MRIFELHRTEDESGVSGTGIVAEGVQFTNGRCALTWHGPLSSTAIYQSIEDVEKIHGHGGKTKIIFISPE